MPSLGSLAGAAGGALAGAAGTMDYASLKTKYTGFTYPEAEVLLGGTAFNTEEGEVIVDDIRIELTAGYEASIATFRLYDAYDPGTGAFRFDLVKDQVMMGNSVTIQLGYISQLVTVFVGFICGVSFGFEEGDLPYIEVTAMDAKGIMMGGSYASQLTATTYSAAVREVLDRMGQGAMQQMGGVTAVEVTNTPDAGGGAAGGLAGAAGGVSVPSASLPGGTAGPPKSSPITVEMVGESDYEFVVRAAKRYNYEFFIDRGKILFRPAKSDTSTLMKLGIQEGIQTFRIEYSLTGVVGKIEARAMDPGKGEAISANSKFNNTISTGQKAKQIVGAGAKVYLDASITSKEEAQARVDALMEKMSYRLGQLEADCVGIPDLVPGRFIEISGMGTPADNRFYLTTVTHELSSEKGYRTRIEGCASKLEIGMGGGSGLGGLASGGSLPSASGLL